MANVRAKFRCVKVEQSAGMSGRTLKFAPMYDTTIPEDRRYSQATPSGELTMYVDNPAVSFELGEYYYLDFTKVEAAPAE